MSTLRNFFKNLFVAKREDIAIKKPVKTTNELVDEANDILKKYNQGGNYEVTEEQMQDMKKKFFERIAFYTSKHPETIGTHPLELIIKASHLLNDYTNPIEEEDLLNMVKEEFYKIDDIARRGESFRFKSETFWYMLKMDYSTGECYLEFRVPFRFN